MKKIIVFDIDGTLCDTKDGIICAFNHVLKEFGEEDIKEGEEARYIGPPVKQSFMKYHGFTDENAEKATSLYRKVYVENYVANSELYSNAKQTLTLLKEKGYVLCVATMKTKPQVDRLFEIFQVGDLFDMVQTALPDGSLSKAGMLRNIIEEYDTAQYYMVGDTEGDYKASVEAGMEFIAAAYGYGSFTDCDVRYKVENFKEILNLVE